MSGVFMLLPGRLSKRVGALIDNAKMLILLHTTPPARLRRAQYGGFFTDL